MNVGPRPTLDQRWVWVGLGLLLTATVAAYLPSIHGDFVLDDVAAIADPMVVSPGRVGAADWLLTTRPLLRATFALNHATVGLATLGWHVTNLLVHLAAVVLAWRFARRVFFRAGLARAEGPALFAAGLFALHPLQTESVSYVSQRAESLASACYLAALLVLLARDEARSRRGWLLAIAGVLEALGLLVKPIVATLPAAWLLLAALVPPDGETNDSALRRMARRLPAVVPLFVLSVASAALEITRTAGAEHAGFDVPGLPAGRYLATQLRVVPTYLELLVWPVRQCADWAFTLSDGLLDPASLAGAAFLGAVALLSIWLASRATSLGPDAGAMARLLGFGIPFFLVALAPSSSVVPLLDPLAEHRVYLAALGIFVAATGVGVTALRRLAPRRAALAGGVIAAAVLIAAGLASARRNEVWASALAFYQDTAAKAPGKARVQMNLGTTLGAAQRHEEALVHFQRARSLWEDGSVSKEPIFQGIVVALVALDRLDQARSEVEDALRQTPRSAVALALLAKVEFASGHDREASAAARAALEVDPANAMALKYLWLASARHGD